MRKTSVFPSVYEETSIVHQKVAESFVDGIKITIDEKRSYLVGNLALTEGAAPHKFLNPSPEEFDYRIISMAALVLATGGKYLKLKVTTGFPFISYLSYKQAALSYLKGEHNIQIDSRPFGGAAIETVKISIDSIDIITEVEGCVKAIRMGDIGETDNFFIASLGFGTFELALSNPSGLVTRTTHSSRGIQYAISVMEKELIKTQYISMISEKQLEEAFQRGYIIINRKKMDIKDIRSKAIQIYYSEVISPAMKKKFLDNDFNSTNKLYLAGGGAMFPELVNLFQEEFKGILEVIVYPEPHLCAATGYAINSLNSFKSDSSYDLMSNQSACVGIDIGNSNTVVVTELPAK